MSRIFMVFFFAAMGGLEGAHADSAVISQVSEDVSLRTATLGASSHKARALQIIAPGSTLDLPERTQAVVICSNDRVVKLSGPNKWQPNSESCQSGRPVAKGTYERLRPSQGRAAFIDGSALLEAPSRSDDENGKVPVLVRPRSPQLGSVLISEASPTLVWTAVTRAERYDVVLKRGGSSEVSENIPVQCKKNDLTEPRETCAASWPGPPLRPGEEFELQIRAHTPWDTARPVRDTDPSTLRLADDETRREMEKELAGVHGDSLPKATQDLLRATVFLRAELFNEAAVDLGEALEEDPVAEVAVGLADLYLGLGQWRAALNCYERAERLLPATGKDEVRAALHLGRGRLHVRKNENYPAVQELEKAAKLFELIGDAAAAEIARKEAELASRNL